MKTLLILAAVSLQPDEAAVPRYESGKTIDLQQRELVPCLREPETTSHVTWELRDREGHVLQVGAQDVRQRC